MEVVKNFKLLLKIGETAFFAKDMQRYEVATRLGSKILRNLAESDNVDLALALEPEWYNRLVKKVEVDEHYHRSFVWHKESLWNAGRRCNSSTSTSPAVRTDPEKLVFVAHTGALLGHTEVMLRVVEAWRGAGAEVSPHFASLGGMQPQLEARLKNLGIPYAVAPKKLRPSQQVTWLRELICSRSISTAVWLSTPCWVPYVFGYGIAQRQVMWSLKFHGVHLGPSIIHIGMSAQQRGKIRINGDEWFAYAPPLSIPRTKIAPETISKIRARWIENILIGTLAREEKLNSPAFISAVIEILQRCPTAHYIYTGRKPPEALEHELKRLGLSERASYLGWVDTAVYAAALDIFLESFPFGCGITGMQALMVGTPVVSHRSGNTLPNYYPDLIEQSPKSLWRIGSMDSDYVGAAVQLVSDVGNGINWRDQAVDVDVTDRIRSLQLLELINIDAN